MDFAGIQNLIPSGPNVMTAQHGDDRGLFVQFYDEAVVQTFESEKAGRQIVKSEPYIHILLAGGKSDLKRPVKLVDDGREPPPDPVRFPRQWAAYKANQEQVQSGTLIELWPAVNKAQVFELKAARVFTVEQLAAFPDSSLHLLGMMGRELRDKAIKFLQASSGDHAAMSALEAENKTLKTDLDILKKQVAKLAAMQPKRGPGRPRKEENVTNDEA